MKKLIALLIALTLMLSLAAVAESSTDAERPTVFTFGTLSMLNMTEEEYQALTSARVMIVRLLGLTEPPKAPDGAQEFRIVYYDSLDALLMALNAGDIKHIEIYESVARYLCAANDNLRIGYGFDPDKASETFT